MLIVCPKCGERCEIDFEPEVGQHIICPFCEQKFSYGEQQDDVGQAGTVMAVCPYCGFAEPVDEQFSGRVGECSRCHREFTIRANAKGIPLRAQSTVSAQPSTGRADAWLSAVSRLDPGLLVNLLMGIGIAIGSLFIVAASAELLFWGLFLMMVATLAPKFGATSDIKRLIRYLVTCAVLAVVVRGGCYGLHQNQIQKHKQAVAAKKVKVDARVQKLARKYFGHELCEWCPEDSVNSKPMIQGLNPFSGLQCESEVEKSFVSSDWDGCLFELRANLHQKPKLPGVITDEFTRAKVSQFKNLPLIEEITKTLGREPRLVRHPSFAGEIVNLNAEFNSDETTGGGEPLISIKISYSLSSGRLLASQLGRDPDATDYSNNHEDWNFEIWYNGH